MKGLLNLSDYGERRANYHTTPRTVNDFPRAPADKLSHPEREVPDQTTTLSPRPTLLARPHAHLKRPHAHLSRPHGHLYTRTPS